MNTIFVLNRMYSPVNVFIVGPDGGIGGILRLPGGTSGKFLNCPPWEYAISAFAVSDNSLQHLGKVRPSLAVYELTPNQGVEQLDAAMNGVTEEMTSTYVQTKR